MHGGRQRRETTTVLVKSIRSWSGLTASHPTDPQCDLERHWDRELWLCDVANKFKFRHVSKKNQPKTSDQTSSDDPDMPLPSIRSSSTSVSTLVNAPDKTQEAKVTM